MRTPPSPRSSTSCATSISGWFLRYLHANGASFFFIVTYIHIFRGLYYGSYKAPREMVWMLGLVIFLLMMATAFMGYVLPWGQMSFWAAKVITGLFGAIPVVGEPVQHWLLGGYAPDQATLTRFFSLHYLLPFVIAGVIILHIWALHIPGSGNPTGVDVKTPQDTVPFHPYYTAKDGFGVGLGLLFLAVLVFFLPNYLGHPAITSRPTRSRRPRISCPNGISGRSTRSCAPSPSTSSCRRSCGACWRCSARSSCSSSCPGSTSRRCARAATGRSSGCSSGSCSSTSLVLGYCGGKPAEEPYVMISQLATIYYFAHFLIILPILSWVEKTQASAQFDFRKRAAWRGGGSRAARHRSGQRVRGRRRHGSHSRHPGWSRLRAGSPPGRCSGAWSQFVEGAAAGRPWRRASTSMPRARRPFRVRRAVRPVHHDQQQLQRGFQVYPGGLRRLPQPAAMSRSATSATSAITRREVRSLAASWPLKVPSIDPRPARRPTRKALPADHIPSPFANEAAARAANNNALPPDLADDQGARGRGRPISTRC